MNNELKPLVSFNKVEKQATDMEIRQDIEQIVKSHKGPEQKKYLILLNWENDDDTEKDQSWEIIEGRTETYNYIKNVIDDIDVFSSLILVETVTLADVLAEDNEENKMNIYAFMKRMEEAGFFNDGFDIDEHITM